MKTAIYARVSTEGQAERQTIESQLLACREYAAQKGYEVVGEFLDDGVSGSIPFAERRAGLALLTKAPERVVIYCPDRLGRDVTEALLAVREFKRLQIVPEFVSQSFDDTPEGRFTFQVFLAVAELERALITRRMQHGRQRSVRNGAYVCNQVPYGYRRLGKGLSIDPQEADTIKRIYDWCIAGNGLAAICFRLRDLHIAPPSNGAKPAREWHTATIHRILTDRRYIGEAHYGDLPMSCPPIVDQATFRQAQAALTARKAHSGRPVKHDYLLAGKLFCRRCGSLFYVDTTSRGKAIYRCGGIKKHRAVPSHEGVKIRWRAEVLEETVRRWAKRILNKPEELLAQADAWEWLAEEIGGNREERDRLQALLDGLTERRQRLIDMRMDKGEITHEEFSTRLSRIEAERSEVMKQLRALQESPPTGEIYREFAQYLRDVSAGRGKLTEVGREDIDHLIDRIWVEDNGDLRIEGRAAGKSLPSTRRVRVPAQSEKGT